MSNQIEPGHVMSHAKYIEVIFNDWSNEYFSQQRDFIKLLKTNASTKPERIKAQQAK